MRTPFKSLAVLAILAVAACVPAPRQTPSPPPPIAVAPAPQPTAAPLAADWRDWPVTAGNWRYRSDGAGRVASFGATAASALLELRCDPATRRITLVRVSNSATPLTVRTSSGVRALAVAAIAGDPARVAVTLAGSDPLLDAIGFSRGRFVVEQANMPPLVVPAWAEIERVTEDCR